MGLIERITGTHSQRELKKIRPVLARIEGLRPQMQMLSDAEIKERTDAFRERLLKGETKDDILPEAYALCREASRRVLGMEHFPVQLIGGIVLHQGRIAEMRTGEGKTLVATLPAYLNSLDGKGCHVVTVNSYLAKRDSEWMGKLYDFLGVSCGCIDAGMDTVRRKEAYGKDITYVTNDELGFDYLRDNMASSPDQTVLRGLHFAVIDEVDSILIDEARTPLIISGKSGKSTKIYEACDHLARMLKRGEDREELTKMDYILGTEVEETGDYIVNEKDKIVTLTERGVERTEKFFHIKNLSDPANLDIQHGVILALRAHNLMFLDRDYIVKDGEVLIVDQFTGRIMPGRRYSDGLHQAIEAKEKVKIKEESITYATITFQNFFNKFEKKSGMTGTAMTEEAEFRSIYGLDVVEIPTNRPVIRKDSQDIVFKTKKEKYAAIVRNVQASCLAGQPVLVGTPTIEVSEQISSLLKEIGIPHSVLNAKNHEAEAHIVEKAGIAGTVTIATNMAGRGTDIKLDDKAREMGGLKVIGSERHESRRIDNQLRGRSGRQGDPGESVFYISLEDDLLKNFGSKRMLSMFEALNIEDDEPVSHKLLTSAVETAQKKLENNNYAVRKNLLEYDRVVNEQREVIYGERDKVMTGSDRTVEEAALNAVSEVISDVVRRNIGDFPAEKEGIGNMITEMKSLIPVSYNAEEYQGMEPEQIYTGLLDRAVSLYYKAKDRIPEEHVLPEIVRAIMLQAIDSRWRVHLDDMMQLKQGINFQSMGKGDPVVEYRISGIDMFNEMTGQIMEDIVRMLYHVKIEITPSPENGGDPEMGGTADLAPSGA